MCCFNKVNLIAVLSVHKRIINKDCTVKNSNEDLNPQPVSTCQCLRGARVDG